MLTANIWAERARSTSFRRHRAVTYAPSLTGGRIMTHRTSEKVRTPAKFGRRRVRPRICVADVKHHIRTFLREALEELDFIACECAQIGELQGVLAQHLPDLLLVGFSDGGATAGAMLEM